MRFYRYTLFNTPLVTSLFRPGARLVLKLNGWKLGGSLPDLRKFVVIAYPHTSNWDVPYTLAISLVFRLQVHWMGKSSLFCGPFGPVMKWLGSIPMYLDESRNVVQQMIAAFGQADELIVVISPEANRACVETWNTGFYHIATGAGVPIVLGFLDFTKREGGYLVTCYPGGDIESDFAEIRSRYRGPLSRATGDLPGSRRGATTC